MTISSFTLMSKGASDQQSALNEAANHDFAYVLANQENANFHAYFDEHESWINHRDDGKCLNADASMVQRLLCKSDKNKA